MRFCPYAQRAHLVLNAKNVPYHTVNINLTEKPEWLVDFSPLLKVPALQLVEEKDQPSLIESLIISEYLDDKYPENPRSRMKICRWRGYSRDGQLLIHGLL